MKKTKGRKLSSSVDVSRLWPITLSMSFMNASPAVVAEWLAAWRQRLHDESKVDLWDAGLESNVRRLEPFTSGAYPRELVVGTANAEWSAVFNCDVHGGDSRNVLSVLGKDHGVLGVGLVCSPDMRESVDGVERYGSRQFSLVIPHGKGERTSERNVYAGRDGGSRWSFEQFGEVQPFEETAEYENRRVKDRLTVEMLTRYAGHFGLRPFDLNFYSGPSYLITSPIEHHTSHFSMTLEEARIANGFD